MTINNLGAVAQTLACIKEAMERTRPAVLVDEYYQVLFALARINEVGERLEKVIGKRED
ncbi:MAG: hypothetical protein KKH04_10010 [Proteobacteria bacterium]|nr:hypothetical protein [Pseudomonadota bacterium]